MNTTSLLTSSLQVSRDSATALRSSMVDNITRRSPDSCMQIDASARVSKKLSLLVAGTALLLGGMALPSVCSAADTANPNEVGAKDIHNLMRPGNSGRAAIITFDQHGTGDVLLTLENEADPISSNDLGPDNIQK